MSGSFYIILTAVAALVLWRRTRNFYRPIHNGKRLLYPAFFMLPALSAVFNPNIHAPWYDWIIAAAIGLGLSVPLIWTTNYEIREDNQIYAKKNFSFIVAFLVILAIRFELRQYLSIIEPQTLAVLFMIVAICYVVPWRVASYLKFKKVSQLRSPQSI